MAASGASSTFYVVGINTVQVPMGCGGPSAPSLGERLPEEAMLDSEAIVVAAVGRAGSHALADLLCWAFADQEERTKAIEAFRDGKKDVLVATDVASKGLDFPAIQHVINYDMPEEIENYGRHWALWEGSRGQQGSVLVCAVSWGRDGLSHCAHPGLILSLSPQFTALGVQAVRATPALPPPSSTRPVVRNSTGLGAGGGSWAVARRCSEQAGWLVEGRWWCWALPDLCLCPQMSQC